MGEDRLVLTFWPSSTRSCPTAGGRRVYCSAGRKPERRRPGSGPRTAPPGLWIELGDGSFRLKKSFEAADKTARAHRHPRRRRASIRYPDSEDLRHRHTNKGSSRGAGRLPLKTSRRVKDTGSARFFRQSRTDASLRRLARRPRRPASGSDGLGQPPPRPRQPHLSRSPRPLRHCADCAGQGADARRPRRRASRCGPSTLSPPWAKCACATRTPSIPRCRPAKSRLKPPSCCVLNDTRLAPFSPAEEAIQNEEVRLKYRYVDLRRPRCSATSSCATTLRSPSATTSASRAFSKSKRPSSPSPRPRARAIFWFPAACIPASSTRCRSRRRSSSRSS